MSTPDDEGLARGWRWAEQLASEEAERLASVSDEEFDAAMAELPGPQSAAAKEDAEAVAVPRRASKASEASEASKASEASNASNASKEPRARWMVWAAAACVALFVLACAAKRREIVAWWHRGEIAPDRERLPPREEPPSDLSPTEMAAGGLRREAKAACDRKEWAGCLEKLDRARAIDGKGEEEPGVKELRGRAMKGLAGPVGDGKSEKGR